MNVAGELSVDLETNKGMNERMHHTSDYDVQELVVRRGDEFSLTVNITGKSYDKDTDLIKLILSTGGRRVTCM